MYGVVPPVAVTVTFDNLIQNEKNISFTAWEKASKVILASSAKNAPVNIFTGPKTTPLFEETSLPVSLVSRLFPNNEEAKTVIWIRYGYDDIAPTTVIVEGEMDKLAVEVAGLQNCVSVPDGAPAANAKNLETKFDLADYLRGVPNAPVHTVRDILDRGLFAKQLEAGTLPPAPINDVTNPEGIIRPIESGRPGLVGFDARGVRADLEHRVRGRTLGHAPCAALAAPSRPR